MIRIEDEAATAAQAEVAIAAQAEVAIAAQAAAEIVAQAEAATEPPPPVPDLVSLTAEELEYLRESLELRGYED